MSRSDLLHIAIDGPVAAGKGTIASGLAHKLRILYFNTGAMYRAVTFVAIENNIPLNDEHLLLEILKKIDITFSFKNGDFRILIGTRDITNRLGKFEISKKVPIVASLAGIRKYLVKKQKDIAKNNSIVMEGRDIASVVLPNADVKIYLTADQKTRVNRRLKQLTEKGEKVDYDRVSKEIQDRDEYDMNRIIDPLKLADDAIVLDSTDLSIDEVVNTILEILKKLPIKKRYIRQELHF